MHSGHLPSGRYLFLPILPSSSLCFLMPGSAEVICGSNNILPQHETWSPSKRVFAATYSLSALQRSLGPLHYPSLVKVPIQPPPRFPGTGIMSDLSWSLQNGIFRFLPLKSTPDFSCEISRSPSRHSSYFGAHWPFILLLLSCIDGQSHLNPVSLRLSFLHHSLWRTVGRKVHGARRAPRLPPKKGSAQLPSLRVACPTSQSNHPIPYRAAIRIVDPVQWPNPTTPSMNSYRLSEPPDGKPSSAFQRGSAGSLAWLLRPPLLLWPAVVPSFRCLCFLTPLLSASPIRLASVKSFMSSKLQFPYVLLSIHVSIIWSS